MRANRGAVLSIAVVILAVVGVRWGTDRWPTGPAAGGPILPLGTSAGSATSSPTRLRIACFNIHSGVGQDEKRDLERTAGLLKNFDLISLHEVAGTLPWQENQADQLGEKLGMASLFSPTERHLGFPAFGNGILTRTPITQWTRTPLPNGFHMAHRQYIHLVVPFGGKNLNVIVCHMGKKSDRRRQFGVVSEVFKSLPEPAILMGDLNTRPEDRMMTNLIASGARDVIGERIAPRDRVDFILTRGLKCVDAGVIDNEASDHPVAWAEIEAVQ